MGAPNIFWIYIAIEVVLALAVIIYEFAFKKGGKKKSL